MGTGIRTIVLAAALLAIGMPVTAFQGEKEPSMPKHRDGRGTGMEMVSMDMLDELNGECTGHADSMGLSDEQAAKMKPVKSDMRKKHVRFSADLKIAEIELMEIMDVKDFDLEKAASAVRKIADIKTSHNLDMLKTMKEMRAGLTEEQFRKMRKTMSMMPDRKKPAHRKMKR